MMDVLFAGKLLPVVALGPLLSSAMEFKSSFASVKIQVIGQSWEEVAENNGNLLPIDTVIEIFMNDSKGDEPKAFEFSSEVKATSLVNISPPVSSATILLPCSVEISDSSEIELVAPLDISARSISFISNSMVLKSSHQSHSDTSIFIQTDHIVSTVEKVSTNAVTLCLSVLKANTLTYPLVQYVEQRLTAPSDPNVRKKYFRFRRILLEFRSHSKGSLKKYKYKIEHERVLKNQIGRDVLAKLVSDGILRLEGVMYELFPDVLAQRAGVSWLALRKGDYNESLIGYLRSI